MKNGDEVAKVMAKAFNDKLDYISGYSWGAPLIVNADTRIYEYEFARPNAVREALLKTNYKGILGAVKFDANNQSHNNLMYMLVENGKLGVKDLVAGQ